MNTGQLIVLWYAAVAVMIGLYAIAQAKHSPPHVLLAIVIFAGVFIYTLRPHPEARKRLVLVSVLTPFLCLGLGMSGWWLYTSSVIAPSEIELIDPRLPFEKSTMWLTGRVRNHSSYMLTEYTVDISFYDKGEVIDHFSDGHKTGTFTRDARFQSVLLLAFTPSR
jgi:hypothetical protein